MLMSPSTSPLLPPAPHESRRVMTGLLALTAALAIAVPALIVGTMDRRPAIVRKLKLAPTKVVPASQMPQVEPLAYAPVTREDAVAFNATVPFSTAPNPAARPFTFGAPSPALDRAVDCLAAAQLYEAGDDVEGERAIAQVIINRVRHPAFPKTICGVVFEGSERTTGCQFTFACDGALARHRFSDDAWTRARFVARAALSGSVFRPVGHATHYHTDWVVPYWSASLDKVTAIKTHLFFRWTGWWGTPPAFYRKVSADEPAIISLARFSDAHRTALALDPQSAEALGQTLSAARTPAQPLADDPNTFLVVLAPNDTADDLPAIAAVACGDRAYCKFLAWREAALTPKSVPLGVRDIASMAFSYRRDRQLGVERSLWNCTIFSRITKTECMKSQMLADTGTADGIPRPQLLVEKPQLLIERPQLITPRADSSRTRGATGPAAPRMSGTLQPPPPAAADQPARR